MEKNSYDPNKSYRWQPDTEFKLTGAEFGIVLNSLRAIIMTEEAQRILLANEANKIVENILYKGVESGDVTEAKDEQPSK